MQRLDVTAVRALRALLDGQPVTDAKIAFAWRIAAGPSLGRAATLLWSPTGTLRVRARSEAWRLEIVRARTLIESRLSDLLGPDVVHRIVVLSEIEETPQNPVHHRG